MRIIIEKDYQDIGKTANKFMRELLINNPNATLGLATGSSPVGLYKEMIADNKAGITTFKNIKTVNLDEYVGLPEGHDQTYRYFMNDNLFNHIDIDKNNTRVPNGMAENLENACKEYTDYVAKNIPDVQILGIGSNGHIAFNEPGTPFDAHTHIVTLKEGTRQDNARFFSSIDEVPTHAITMGIADIMQAKMIILVANGIGKSKAIYDMAKGPITTDCPASILQSHPNVVVIIDESAGYLLK